MLNFYKKTGAKRVGINFQARRKFLLAMILIAMSVLVVRAVYLQILDKQFLQQQGQNRFITKVAVSAYRGKILDRNGNPLAISTPVASVWVNPIEFERETEKSQAIRQISKLLNMPYRTLSNLINKNQGKHFVYIKRQINPETANTIKNLKIGGIHLQREFKRFYPTGEVTGHLLGFTNIDDIGQEGLERAYETLLHGQPGSKRVIRDRTGRIIDRVDTNVEAIKEPQPGQNLQLSIDQHIQYITYKELKAAVNKHSAYAASAVVIDAKSGEILAIANMPAFNPNNRRNRLGKLYRNRAVTDVFEPGSTVKPFVIACALDKGYVTPSFSIDTAPGWYGVGRNLVKDVHNYGIMDLTKVLQKSSNVAVSKIALQMPADTFLQCYRDLGFGSTAGIGFPGESSGSLPDDYMLRKFEQATLSFGYGMSASILQLARAYTALADDGVLHSLSLIKQDNDLDSQQVISQKTAKRVRKMLESVVQKGGTATKAAVPGYQVAGKTGTVKKAGAGGYTKDSYLAVFAGMAPANNPKLIIAVVVDEPHGKVYYGGLVAAPIFANIMRESLRALDIPPDQTETMSRLLEPR